MDQEKGYYVGLDMGTASVGWAVTDHNYNILRAKGKDMWGVREFETAETAKSRRMNRTSRRRRERETIRLGHLKDYFSEAIAKIDSEFFTRLENSKYWVEDKDESVRYKSAIFPKGEYSDKEYYKDYPTIFHLRSELIHNSNPHDVRLVYLAIANLFKRRGHFLNAGMDEDCDVTSMKEVFERFVELASELTGVHIDDSVEDSAVKDILSRRDISRTKKGEELMRLFAVDSMSKESKVVCKELIKALTGCKANGIKIFSLDDEENKVEIDFSSASYEDGIGELVGQVGDDNYELIDSMKAIYDIAMLTAILGEENYLSDARVKSYEKHHADLRKLKKAIAKYCEKKEYDAMFRTSGDGSYSAYVNSVVSHNVVERRKSSNRNGLFAKVHSLLVNHKEDPQVQEILTEIANESFLPKQLTSSNGVIPNQVHKRELAAILTNAKKYLPFLNETDDTNLSIADKIMALFSFQIPYYIGPAKGNNSWMVRKSEGEILPWNMEEKVDVNQTAEQFITSLVRKCTYIPDARVLPKNSLLYESFCVLNEINNIRVRGERIEPEVKQKLYNDLFVKGKKVTKKQVADFLTYKDSSVTENDISGIDNTVNATLGSLAKFISVFGADKMKLDSYKKLAEDIIFTCTVFGDDRVKYKNVLKEKYAQKLSETELKKIRGIRFKDWGRLSKEFLELQGCDISTGEIKSLIRALWDSDLNLMELINSEEFTYAKALEEHQSALNKSISEFCFDDLSEYYFSAPVKRMIWQTLKLIKEIIQIKGTAPDAIFVEMTRTDEEKGDKGRKDSREKDLLRLYKDIKDSSYDWNELIKESNASGKLKSKKMYLYIKQMGRDMYSGLPIDLDDLFNDNLYDIDHIYPRQFTTDNNLENNLVLVKKETNAAKTNDYPLSASIRKNPRVVALWDTLHDKGLMNDEKYHRLTSNAPLTEEQKAGFIARQLVETGQGTKGVTDLLKQLLPGIKIVYSKAGNVSDFRNEYDIYKCRSINEFHHAHDAYLNVVIGNVYEKKFTQNPLNFIRNEYAKNQTHYNLGKMYAWDIIRNGECAWKAGEQGTIVTVKKMLAKNTPLITRMCIEGHGALYHVQPITKDSAKEENYVGLKATLPVTKYGGYGSIRPAYFIFVEHGKAKKRIKSFDVIPLYAADRIHNIDELKDYCIHSLGMENPRILCSHIRRHSLLCINGYYVYISGLDNRKNVEFMNATSLKLSNCWNEIVHNLEKSEREGRNVNTITEEDAIAMYDLLLEKHQDSVFANSPKPLSDSLVRGKELFATLDLDKKCTVLRKLLNISSLSSTVENLSEIEGVSEAGRIRVSGNMTNKKKVEIVNQSITGLIENRIDLLKL